MLRPADLLHMLCYLHAFHRASTHGFRHVLPASYGAAWSLPRLNFHQRVMPSFARRAAATTALIYNKKLKKRQFPKNKRCSGR